MTKVDSLNYVSNTKLMPLEIKARDNDGVEVFLNDSNNANVDELNLSNKNVENYSEDKNDNKKKWLIAAGIVLGTIAVGVTSYLLFKKIKMPPAKAKSEILQNSSNKFSKSAKMPQQPLVKDEIPLKAVSYNKKTIRDLPKSIPFNYKGACVSLSERCASNSAVDIGTVRTLPGYVNEKGEILPYLYVEGLSVEEKGKGLGKKIMAEIIQLAKEKYGGRLLLKPQNRDCNPSIFYHKCGLLSTTKKGAKEISDFLERGIPFQSGYSDAMYLPIQ